MTTAPSTQPVALPGDDAGGTYVHCTEGPLAASFAPFAQRCRARPGWTVHELATGHDAMLTAPDELVALLLR